MKYFFSNVLGGFVFDNQFNLVEEAPFRNLEEYKSKEKTENQLKAKYKDSQAVSGDKLKKVLLFFKDKQYFPRFYSKNKELTRQKIKEGVSEDLLVIQAISNIEELDRANHILGKRLREWYGWYLPELGEKVGDKERFAELVMEKSKKELMREEGLKESLGADLGKEDVEEILLLGKEVLGLYKLRKRHEVYLKKVMEKYCPNLLELGGASIGAKLIELGKGLKHLALLPASTVQLLGAEKALFRHIKTGAKSPKYGVIVNHPVVQKAKKQDKGKAARALADKLSWCARLDYFKGEFKAKVFRKELEERFKG